jgi:hypothetical protein
MNRTAAYIDPMAFVKSCCVLLDQLTGKMCE